MSLLIGSNRKYQSILIVALTQRHTYSPYKIFETMNDQLLKLSSDQLKKLLSLETKLFIEGLDKNYKVEELQIIRNRIKELLELLEKRKHIA